MSAERYIVRRAVREDMVGCLKLVQDEGWNKVLEQMYLLFDLYPQGFYVAESTEGDIISHCISLPLDDANGFICNYVTKENWRRQGIGRKVFDLSYKSLGNRNIGINSAEKYQDMYASYGFRVSTGWVQTYYCPIKHLKTGLGHSKTRNKEILRLIPIGEITLDRILTYDNKIHAIGRRTIIQWYLDFAYFGLSAVDREGNLVGWGLLYKADKAFCLMPLYADTPHIAKAIMSGLLEKVQKEDHPLKVRFPVENTEARAMFEEFGFTQGPGFLSRRMFTDHAVPLETKLVFSVLNLDTGFI